MGVDVKQDLLAGLTRDAVDLLAGSNDTRASERWAMRKRHALRA
jgi:hypothetical protein